MRFEQMFHFPREARYLRRMFKEALEAVVMGAEGGLAGLLMDFQGVAVESFTKEGATFDVDTIGAEYSVVIKSIQRAAESLEAGDAREVAVVADKMITVFRVVNAEYFVALALAPDANVGKARYLLRTAVPKLVAELE